MGKIRKVSYKGTEEAERSEEVDESHEENGIKSSRLYSGDFCKNASFLLRGSHKVAYV